VLRRLEAIEKHSTGRPYDAFEFGPED